MSYLNVDVCNKNLLEDSHQRKVQKVKVISSSKRNDKYGKSVIPNTLGSFRTYEDRLEAVLSAGTINQNLEQLRLNRLAIKRGLEYGQKNPKIVYSSLYEIPDKTEIHPSDAAATAFPYQNAITTNANYDPVATYKASHNKENPNIEQIRFILAVLMQHEQSHILFINYIDRKYGKKMKREIIMRSEQANYNYRQALGRYITTLQKYKFDVNNPIVKKEKELADKAYILYVSDPLEFIADIIEHDMRTYDDVEVIPRNANLFYKIIDNAVKDIRSGRR